MSDSEATDVGVASEPNVAEILEASEQATTPPQEAGGWDLIKVLGICWSTDLAVAIGLIVVSLAMGREFGKDGQLNLSPWAFMIGTAISMAVLLWACWNFACRRYNRSLAEGLKLVPISKNLAKIWVAAGVAVGVMACVLHHIFPPLGPSFLDEIFLQPSAESPLIRDVFYPAVVWGILGAVAEEIYYRGFLYTVFQRMLGAIGAMAIIMLWFWLLHVPQYFYDPVAMVMVAVASILLTCLRHKYDSTWPPIFCHVAYNATVLTVFVVRTEMYNASV